MSQPTGDVTRVLTDRRRLRPAGSAVRTALALAVAFATALPAGRGQAPDGPIHPTLSAIVGQQLREPQEVRGGRIVREVQADPSGEKLHVRSRWSGMPQPGDGGSVPLLDVSIPLQAKEEIGYRRLQHRGSQEWYGSTFWGGPDWTRVGKDWHHPGQHTPSIRAFRVPRDGTVRIEGRVFKRHVGGDGIRARILHGDKTLWNTEIAGNDQKGSEHNVSQTVRAGEVLRFVVHRRGSITCDTTGWDPAIRYPDGTVYQASQGFSPQQGQNNWYYEMEATGALPEGLPGVFAVGNRFELIRCGLGSPAGEGRLPIATIDSGVGWGIAIAVDTASDCQIETSVSATDVLRIVVRVPRRAGSGFAGELPAVMLEQFRDSALAALLRLQRSPPAMPHLARRLQEAYGLWRGRFTPDADLLLLAQAEWQREDKIQDRPESYLAAAQDHLRRSRELLEELRAGRGKEFLAAEESELARLHQCLDDRRPSLGVARKSYLEVRALKRRIALANPLLDFDQLFFCKRVPTSYSHLVMQYFGWRARPGGGLFVLDRPGRSLSSRDLLGGKLAGGNVLEPRLSYDGRRIVFSYVPCREKPYEPGELDRQRDEGYYHLYEVNIDGSGLRQLTEGPYDDLMPNYLPDGGIVFCSTRRKGHARCFGGQFSARWHVYTLHRIDGDGGNPKILSVHDTNEWFPTVAQSGLVLYSRWDYIDRDAVTHQNLWATRPDGTNPFAVWGNASPTPHCSFQMQPIPGSSKIVFTAAPHHSIAAGSIAVVDPRVHNNSQAAITRITPEIPFPEAESRNIPEYYASPWPLSERFFLVSYSSRPLVWEPGANAADALGLYLLDARGNRELLYRDLAIGSETPIPLRPRPTPPVLPSSLPKDPPAYGEMVVADVYQGLGGVPRGMIKELRVVQIFPKTSHVANSPPIGLAREENARAILGTVPVAPDGSARFLVPGHTPVCLQALDAQGRACQTMRSLTYVQPGERVSCVGCHENGMTAPVPALLAAQRRPPATIEPGELGGRPFSFVEVVQPVLDHHCLECHGEKRQDGKIDLRGIPERQFTRSYWSLCGDLDFWGSGTNPATAAAALVPRFGGRNQIQVTPVGGQYGARGSRLMRLLDTGHYGVRLSDSQQRRLSAWIDLNAVFYGSYSAEEQAAQLAGQPISMPDVR